MIEVLLFILVFLSLAVLAILIFRKQSSGIKEDIKMVENSLIRMEEIVDRTEKSIKDEFQRNRTETKKFQE